MNLICLAQQKYLRSYGKKFVCTGNKFRVHSKKFFTHSKKKLLSAQRKFTTCSCSNSYMPIP